MKKIIYKLVLPVIILYVKLKFKSIWHLKEFLYQSNRVSDFLDHSSHMSIKVYFLLKYYERTLRKLGSWVGFSAKFIGLPYFPHGAMGVFIAHHTQIGKNVIIFQQVTIGIKTTLKSSKEYGAPVIGNNVFIGAGAKVIGKIIIGNNCRIGANAVVVSDLPDNSVAVSNKTRIIQKKELDNRFFVEYPNKTMFYDDGNWREKII